MSCNKLVRDKVIDVIADSGKRVTFRILDDEEYKIELERKLDEEVAEFHESKSLEEIADILEVLDALLKAHGYNLRDVKKVRFEKRFARGGFSKRTFLEGVEDV